MDKETSTSLPGTVDRILKPPAPGKREQAQIGIEGVDRIYKDIRIDNVLTDELGQEVNLESGDKVKVTIAKPEPIRSGRHEAAHKDDKKQGPG